MKKHNKYYWEGKSQRAETAKRHTERMTREWDNAIQHSVDRTKMYDEEIRFVNANGTWKKDASYHHGIDYSSNSSNVTMEVVQAGTTDALFFHTTDDSGKVALLNFASYKNPGGGFMVGSRAQEESLCHESYLYNVLREFENTYYEPNKKDLNRGLYRHRGLYSPNIMFFRENVSKVSDVITCAAPNFSVAERFMERAENNAVLRQRIRFMLSIAKAEHVDTLILGAWGCGVFQQDPDIVAQYFIDELQTVFTDAKIHVIFAVIPPLPNQTDNLTPFVKLVNHWNS